jgi:hypothetical protein
MTIHGRAMVLRLRTSIRYRSIVLAGILLGLCLASPALAEPRVDYLVPNHGPPEGGTAVVIVGSGFEAGATVTLGGVAATDVTVIDGSVITATTSDVGSPVTAEVVVTNPDTSSGSRAGGFLFVSTIYYVDQTTGDDGNDGLTPAAAKATIAAALDVYANGTPSDPPIEIRVAEGHYVENLILYYNQVVTGGWNSGFTERDPDTYLTVVDGGRRDYVARSYGVGVSPVLDGFTLLGGERVAITGGFYSTDDNVTLSNDVLVGNRSGGIGGAFYTWLQDEAPAPTIRNSIFVGNRADATGGALGFSTYYEALYPHPFTPTPVVADSVFVGNRSASGAAVSVYPNPDDRMGLRMTGNRLLDNSAGGTGGGLSLLSFQTNLVTLEMTNNLLLANAAGDQGGGLHISGRGSGDLLMRSNTIADNTGLFGGTQIYQSSQSLIVGGLASHVVRGADALFLRPGVAVSYSNVEGGYAGTGNIDADPLFVPGAFGDRYLSQIATGEPGQTLDSPSLDSGDPAAGAGEGVLLWIDPADSLFPIKDRSTRSDGLADGGVLDQGFHWPAPGPPAEATPTLLRGDPAVVSFQGDEWMVLRGSGFASDSRVRFNGADADEQLLVSPAILLARPAPLLRGALTVEVRNPGADGLLDTPDDLTGALGGLTAGDTDPPVWDGAIGVQEVEDLADCDPSLALQWGTASDADSPPVTYEVYRTDLDPFTEAGFVPGPDKLVASGLTDPWWTDGGLDKNSTYWYVVQARDSSEDPRRELNFVISTRLGDSPTDDNANTVPPPPIQDLAVASPDLGATVEMSWTPVYPAHRYRVYRGLDASDVSNLANELGLLDDPHASTFIDDTVPSDEFVFYLVTPEDSCGNQS